MVLNYLNKPKVLNYTFMYDLFPKKMYDLVPHLIGRFWTRLDARLDYDLLVNFNILCTKLLRE